jgi:Uma2 family endonuclease
MSDQPRRRATYQDVLDAPDHGVAEVIRGELHLFPRPRAAHSAAAIALAAELYHAFQRGRGGPGGWIFHPEPELHFADDIVVPDLAGWRRERLPVTEDVAFMTLAPDWLCEILSPSTERIDRMDKMPIYAEAGVQHVWLIHPIRRTVEIFRLRDGAWFGVAVHREAQRVRAEPFDAIELDLAMLWADVAPPRGDRASEPVAVYQVGESRDVGEDREIGEGHEAY